MKNEKLEWLLPEVYNLIEMVKGKNAKCQTPPPKMDNQATVELCLQGISDLFYCF